MGQLNRYREEDKIGLLCLKKAGMATFVSQCLCSPLHNILTNRFKALIVVVVILSQSMQSNAQPDEERDPYVLRHST